MVTAAAATAADAQSIVEDDLKEFVSLAEELAQTAGSIIKQYFRCPSVRRPLHDQY